MLIINEGALAANSQVVQKLWGTEFWVTNTPLYCLKFLKVIPGYQCSIHAHARKDETFVGVFGTLGLALHYPENGEVWKVEAIVPGKKFRIQPNTYHSFSAVNVSWIMEVSSHHDDADVIRLQESRKLEIK